VCGGAAMDDIVICMKKRSPQKDFIAIAAGEYDIGIAPENAASIDLPRDSIRPDYLLNSVPRHRRALRTCMISRFFVSRADFALFVSETGYVTDAEKEGWGWTAEKGMWIKKKGASWRTPFGDEGDDICRECADRLPVFQASWNDAAAFCGWASGKTGKNIALPGEAEWEVFAAAAGVRGVAEVRGSERLISYISSADYCAAVDNRIDGDGHLAPGVLWEWCADWFDAYPAGAPNREFGTVYKVLRGGSLQSHPLQRGREYRFRRCPTARSPYYGFRIAVDA